MSELELLKQKISELENENRLLKEGITSFLNVGKTVTVPEAFKPIFDKAEQTVGSYFQELKAAPSKGTIEINEERYVLLRASSLSVGFLNKIRALYSDHGEEEAFQIGKKFLFDIAHVLGIQDAQNFHDKMNLVDPIEKLSAGPIHFAYTGWAYVDILPESNPSPDENFYLKYHHPFSFEADSWIKEKGETKSPVCIMNAGYSSGWCEESFGIPLTAVEISCRARGDKNCTFIMAHPDHIAKHLDAEVKQDVEKYQIPLFFERKKAEEKIKASLKEKDILLKEIHHRVKNNLQIISSLLNLQSSYLEDTTAKELFAQTKNRIKALALVHEKLHRSEDVKHVNLEEYIRSVVDLLAYSFKDKNKEIVTNIVFESYQKFDIDKAIPCGLIINELVTNAYEHAFTHAIEGKIDIKFKEENQQFELSIVDNGKGMIPGKTFGENERLGYTIVNALVEQLNGKLVTVSDKGCSHVITF